MKNPFCLGVCLLFLLGIPAAWTQDTSSVNVQTSCAHWGNLHLDKRKQFKGNSDDLYQTGMCVGYFSGLIDGMDETGGWRFPDGTTASFRVNRAQIDSTWDVVRAFYKYVDANPLEKGKPAWSVLQKVLTSNKLASFVQTDAPPQPAASTLSAQCKTGANNVIAQYNADSDLKAIDTPTLADVYAQLGECMSTKGISDADSVLVLSAATEANTVILTRALNTLDRHALMAEFRSDRTTTTNKTVSNLPTDH